MSRCQFLAGILNLRFRYQAILSVLLCLALVGCVASPEKEQESTPTWYLTLQKNSSQIIGYGSGASLEIAKSIARNDIATSLKVSIKSDFTMKSVEHGNRAKRDVSSSMKEYTEVLLTDAKVLHSQELAGVFYVALVYDNLPLAQKVYRKLANTPLEKMRYDDFYYDAHFSKTLFSLFGYIPKYDLFFKNSLYYLYISDAVFVLSDSDLKRFFFEKESDTITLKASSKRLHVNDYFHFTLKTKKEGYVSLLEVDEEGRVIVHIDNIKMKADEKQTYPDLDIYDGLQAGIVNQNDTVDEQYMMLLCPKKIDLSLFEHISDSFNENKKAMRYCELSKMLMKCDYTSILLKTVKENQ